MALAEDFIMAVYLELLFLFDLLLDLWAQGLAYKSEPTNDEVFDISNTCRSTADSITSGEAVTVLSVMTTTTCKSHLL